MVGEARLAGARHVAAADEPRVGHGMVRGPKRPQADDADVGIDEPGDGVDGGRLDRLVERERRQDGGQGTGEQRLAAAGGTDHQEVVVSRGGNFDGAAGPVLAAHHGEVERAGSELRSEAGRAHGGETVLSVEVPHDRFEVVRHGHLHQLYEPCLRGVAARYDGSREPTKPRTLELRQDAACGLQPPVERELPEQQRAPESRRVESTDGTQHGDGDGKIERATVLAEFGGREIHGDGVLVQ